MITATFIFSLLNLIGLLICAIVYFRERFIIVSIEEWNELATIYNKVVTAGIIDEEGNLVTQELAGGQGFFKEYVDDDYYEEDE